MRRHLSHVEEVRCALQKRWLPEGSHGSIVVINGGLMACPKSTTQLIHQLLEEAHTMGFDRRHLKVGELQHMVQKMKI